MAEHVMFADHNNADRRFALRNSARRLEKSLEAERERAERKASLYQIGAFRKYSEELREYYQK